MARNMKTVSEPKPKERGMVLVIKPIVVRMHFCGKGRKTVADDARRQARTTQKRAWMDE